MGSLLINGEAQGASNGGGRTRQTPDGLLIMTFTGLVADLGVLTCSHVRGTCGSARVTGCAAPSHQQQRVFDLLGFLPNRAA